MSQHEILLMVRDDCTVALMTTEMPLVVVVVEGGEEDGGAAAITDRVVGVEEETSTTAEVRSAIMAALPTIIQETTVAAVEEGDMEEVGAIGAFRGQRHLGLPNSSPLGPLSANTPIWRPLRIRIGGASTATTMLHSRQGGTIGENHPPPQPGLFPRMRHWPQTHLHGRLPLLLPKSKQQRLNLRSLW